jgi:hypothetical protein
VATFKTWKVTFTAELVSTHDISGASSSMIHESLAQALRQQAGYVSYLVGRDETSIEQTGGDDE